MPMTPVPRMGARRQENHWGLLVSHLAGKIVIFRVSEGLGLKRSGNRRGNGVLISGLHVNSGTCTHGQDPTHRHA